MQSGTFGVMGFWDRSRVDEIWQNALDDLDLEDFEAQEGLEMMRGIPWQQLVHIPAFQVCDSKPCHFRSTSIGVGKVTADNRRGDMQYTKIRRLFLHFCSTRKGNSWTIVLKPYPPSCTAIMPTRATFSAKMH